MKRWLIPLAVVLVLTAVGYGVFRLFGNNDGSGDQPESAQQQDQGFNKQLYSIDEPDSIWLIVNKHRLLDEAYVPESLDAPDMKLRWAKTAESMQVSTAAIPDLEAMNKAAVKAGIKLMLISAYRTASYQRQLYDGYVRSSGKEDADTFSARPGASEHQTGLAVDLGRPDGKCEIDKCFSDTPEGKWLAQHSFEYGFILRYHENAEGITGYMYEPWHFRYVGKELANEVKNDGPTLEEFFGLEPAPDYL